MPVGVLKLLRCVRKFVIAVFVIHYNFQKVYIRISPGHEYKFAKAVNSLYPYLLHSSFAVLVCKHFHILLSLNWFSGPWTEAWFCYRFCCNVSKVSYVVREPFVLFNYLRFNMIIMQSLFCGCRSRLWKDYKFQF